MQVLTSSSFRRFIIYYFIFLLLGLITLMCIDKGDIVLFLNNHANSFLDNFFRITTLLGEGAVFVIPIIIALFIRFSYAIGGSIALIFTGIFTFLGKQVIFKGMPRPTSYFTEGELSNLIEGFTYHHHNSFPSGHTMTAFALMLFIALLVNKKSWSTPLLGLAILIGISRMYLLQHFFMDVVAGSALGIISVVIGFLIPNRWLNKKFPNLENKIRLPSNTKN